MEVHDHICVAAMRFSSAGEILGIVGAGGNFGAVMAAMLFKSENISGASAFFIVGSVVAASAFCVLLLILGAGAVLLVFAGLIFLGIRVLPQMLLVIGVSAILMVGLQVFLATTKTGKA